MATSSRFYVRFEDHRLVGDADFGECSQVAGSITPVPGGVGPMTIAMLLRNCVDSALRKHGML